MGHSSWSFQAEITGAEMRSSLAILLALAVFMTLFIPAIEAANRRRGRGGRKRGSSVGRGRGRQQGRRGRLTSGRGRHQGRRGRTNYDPDAAAADANAVDGGEEGLYNGCDWKTNIGDFLTFCKWRKWCADEQGITDFGPYGGVPEECPPPGEEGEDGGEDAQAEPAGAD